MAGLRQRETRLDTYSAGSRGELHPLVLFSSPAAERTGKPQELFSIVISLYPTPEEMSSPFSDPNSARKVHGYTVRYDISESWRYNNRSLPNLLCPGAGFCLHRGTAGIH